MISSPQLWPAIGETVPVTNLRIEKAIRLARLLQEAGREVFASLVEARKDELNGNEAIVFTVDVERPQLLTHPVNRVEWVQAVFTGDLDKIPEVWLLRKGFPSVPHTMIVPADSPQQMCLYDQGWDEVRLKWTASEFLARIRFWLSKTSTGTLHADDQPLEPLIQYSAAKLILPSDFSVTKANEEQGLIDISRVSPDGAEIVLAAQWKVVGQKRQAYSVAAIFECKPQQHGVIRHQPRNLAELNSLCLAAGLDLVKELTSKIQKWYLEKPDPQILKAKLILIVLLPKTRTGSLIEGVDACAFITAKSVQDVGQSLGAIGAEKGMVGYVMDVKMDPRELDKVELGMIQLHNLINASDAAILNGVKPNHNRIVAIGVGALGSQIFNNLIRSGFGKWTIMDGDILLPHNCSRHFLGSWAVGHGKAEAMASVANEILDGPDIAEGIKIDVLHPRGEKARAENALSEADVVLDFSASVAVTRHLSGNNVKARHISAFLTPGGNCLVLAGEDSQRKIRLDWLEMLHYRGVINIPELKTVLAVKPGNVRYGNACRDLSSQVSQDDVAIWAAVASKNIKRLQHEERAFLRTFVTNENGETKLIEEEISALVFVEVGQWMVRFDQRLLNKLGEYRTSKLPNETGGVLIGHFDTHHRICSIVDFIPSPPDSVEWPISYIRGCEGLNEKIQAIKKQTLEQLQYVGEWHSHPDGASTNPSTDDLQAFAWLIQHMNKEDLPAIMMIVGEREGFRFVATANAL